MCIRDSPEAVDFLRQHHVEEGETIQVIRKLRDSLIIGVQNERVALGKEDVYKRQVFGYVLIAAGIAVTLFLLFGWALPYNGII